eukprot:scaffold4519_cov45-Phaeocystis_antarctica.AAC.1
MWAHLSYETRCFPKGGPGSGSGKEEDEDEDGVLVAQHAHTWPGSQLGAHAATHRSRGPPAGSGLCPLDPRGGPSPRGCRREAAAALWCLPKVVAHSAASDHLGAPGRYAQPRPRPLPGDPNPNPSHNPSPSPNPHPHPKHEHGHCQMGWASGASAVGGTWRMCVHVAVSRGEELLYSYGKKPNAKLFWVRATAARTHSHTIHSPFSALLSPVPERTVCRASCS